MSIKFRLALLVGLLLLGFLGSWVATQRMEQQAAARMQEDARAARIQTLNHWIDLTGRSLPQFAAEYAQTETLTKAIEMPEAGARGQIAQDLRQSGVGMLWILRSDGTVQFAVDDAGRQLGEPPLEAGEFVRLVESTPSPHFHAEQEGGLLEISVRRLASSAGGNPVRWLMIGRRWDDAPLQTLAALAESKISLLAPSAHARAAENEGAVVVLRPLTDWRGREVRVLRLEQTEKDLANLVETGAHSVRLFLGFGLLVITAVGLALQRWVLRPLQRIEQSLSRKDPTVLGSLKTESSELGEVARLVEFSFEQAESLRKNEAALRHTLEERARLGWNLHDGVIQSLYAAGMGLSGVHALLKPEQDVAASRLEQVRGILNETIHDVRNFITGLEPEALKQQSFGQAVSGLLATMKSIRPVRTVVEIDEPLAARLSLPERVHVLQIIREAVSNALRHGEPSQVTVTLRGENEKAECSVIDDGRGFDPGARTERSGLANLAERARELGAELLLDSAPGKGTRVKVVFPSSKPHD